MINVSPVNSAHNRDSAFFSAWQQRLRAALKADNHAQWL